MALLNSYNGYTFLPHFPNWGSDAGEMVHALSFAGREDQTLRSNEERMQFRETPRARLEYYIWPATQLEAQNIADIKRYCLDQNQGKICVPYWVRASISTFAAIAGGTQVRVDGADPLCQAWQAGDVLFIPNPSGDGTYFVDTITSVAQGSVYRLNFTNGLPWAVDVGDRVYPLLFGRLDPQPAEAWDANTAEEFIKVQGDAPARAPYVAGVPLLGSRPVFDMPLDWDDSVQSTQLYDPRINEVGAQVVDEAMQKYVVNAFSLPRPCWSRADIAQIELLARACFGTQQGFWLPEQERWAQVAAAVDPTHFDVLGRGLVETFATEPGATAYAWAVEQEFAAENPVKSGIYLDLDPRIACLNTSSVPCVNGDAVASWISSDASALTFTSVVSGNRPIFAPNIFGSLPGLHFNGTSQYIGRGSCPALGDLTVFIVFKPDNVVQNAYAALLNYYNSQILIRQNASVSGSWSGICQSGPDNILAGSASAPQIFSMARSGTVATVGLNGARLLGAAGSASALTSSDIILGCYAYAAQFFTGCIGKVLIYNRLLSDAEYATVEKWLANIWGVLPQSRGLQITAVATSGSNERCTVPAGNFGVTPSDDLYRLRYARLADNEITFIHDGPDTCSVPLSFVELPHEYAAVDLGQRPAWLYRITRVASTTYWTSYDQSITTGGNTYTPAAIEHANLSESVDGQGNGVELTTWRTQAGSPFVDAAPFAPTDQILVEILRYDLQALGSATLEWTGVVNTTKLEGRRLTIQCATRLERLGATFPRWLVQRRCNTQLYSTACGISRAAKTTSPVVTSVTQAGRLLRLNLTNIGTLPASYHLYGEVKSLTEYRQIEAVTIVNANNIDVRIEHPFAADPVVGVAVELTQGCDLSREACLNQFNNLVNHRGCPFIDENLALKAIPLQTTGGKK